jgi:hypothetical protein
MRRNVHFSFDFTESIVFPKHYSARLLLLPMRTSENATNVNVLRFPLFDQSPVYPLLASVAWVESRRLLIRNAAQRRSATLLAAEDPIEGKALHAGRPIALLKPNREVKDGMSDGLVRPIVPRSISGKETLCGR